MSEKNIMEVLYKTLYLNNFDIDGSYMSDNDIYILTSEGERF